MDVLCNPHRETQSLANSKNISVNEVNRAMLAVVTNSETDKDFDFSPLPDMFSSPMAKEFCSTPSSDSTGTRSPYSFFARSFLGLQSPAVLSDQGTGSSVSRRKREFTPDELKDSSYWVKRTRNNEAARRSRQRRRMEEMRLETRAVELLKENEKLKAALFAIRYQFTDTNDSEQMHEPAVSHTFSNYLPPNAGRKIPFYQVLGVRSAPAPAPCIDGAATKSLYREHFQQRARMDPQNNLVALFPDNKEPHLTFQSNSFADGPRFTHHSTQFGEASTLCNSSRSKNYLELASKNSGVPLDSSDPTCSKVPDSPTTLNYTSRCINALKVYPFNADDSLIYQKGKESSVNDATDGQNGDPPQETHHDCRSIQEGDQNKGTESTCVGNSGKESPPPSYMTTVENWVKHLSFLPHKLRLKVSGTKSGRTNQTLDQKTLSPKEVAVERVSLESPCGSGAHLKYLPITDEDSGPHSQDLGLTGTSIHGSPGQNKSKEECEVSCAHGASEKTFAPTEQNRRLHKGEFTHTQRHIQETDFGKISAAGSQRIERNCRSVPFKFYSKDMRERTENGHLRNQLASLSAEVERLKQILLSKSTA
ncbi:UNVERIFIED_CONTAM: hypothetical protein FKN15_037874 [Acipenser sinensis]